MQDYIDAQFYKGIGWDRNSDYTHMPHQEI